MTGRIDPPGMLEAVQAPSLSPDALRGRVAVVTGATRGAGRGIAAALGEAGAIVYCTGRSTSGTIGGGRSEYGRPETIEETAALVSELGGEGLPVVVDHLEIDEVRGLRERIEAEQGRLDILVNDIWGGELIKGGPPQWNKPIWELDLEANLRLLRLAVDTHLITSHQLSSLVAASSEGLVVEVTDGTEVYNRTRYRLSVFYDLAKVAVTRLAFSQGHELASFGGTVVALTPGFLRSEMMLEAFQVDEANWRDAVDEKRSEAGMPVAPSSFALSESPRFVGRAVAALAADGERARFNQCSLSSGALAQEYGFTDLDGSRPDVWRYLMEVEEGRQAELDAYR